VHPIQSYASLDSTEGLKLSFHAVIRTNDKSTWYLIANHGSRSWGD